MYTNIATAMTMHFASGAVVTNCPEATSVTCETNLPRVDASNAALQTLLHVLFTTLAAVAVLILIIAALRMVINAGDTDVVKKMRRTLIYTSIGLLIALTADALVGFVLSRFTT